MRALRHLASRLFDSSAAALLPVGLTLLYFSGVPLLVAAKLVFRFGPGRPRSGAKTFWRELSPLSDPAGDAAEQS